MYEGQARDSPPLLPPSPCSVPATAPTCSSSLQKGRGNRAEEERRAVGKRVRPVYPPPYFFRHFLVLLLLESSERGEEQQTRLVGKARPISGHPEDCCLSLAGKKYWSYDFVKQPSREECEQTSPSLVFDNYARLHEGSWEEFFQIILGGLRQSEWGSWVGCRALCWDRS